MAHKINLMLLHFMEANQKQFGCLIGLSKSKGTRNNKKKKGKQIY